MERKKMSKIFIEYISIILVLSTSIYKVNAQTEKAIPVRDGIFYPPEVKMHIVPYPFVREADIMWSTRIWRLIDLREKLNHPLYYPLEPLSDRISLFDAILKGIKSDSVLAFDEMYDDFRKQLTSTQLFEILNKVIIISQENPDQPGIFNEIIDTVKITSKDLIEYMIKEEWFFDKQRSVMDCRIIGICPIINTYDEFGNVRGRKKLFWLYFPNVRIALQKEKLFNRNNDAARLSFDEVFSKRFFSSYIIKQSNVFDRSLSDYVSGLDLLLEGEKIKDNLLIVEHDLWEH